MSTAAVQMEFKCIHNFSNSIIFLINTYEDNSIPVCNMMVVH